jgi:UDP-glucose 4-epimerase
MLFSKNLTPVEVFNLGTGKGLSVLEIIQSFEKVSGQSLNYVFVPRRAGDVEKVWADTTRANEVLGWKAEKTVDDCMRTAWEWQKRI